MMASALLTVDALLRECNILVNLSVISIWGAVVLGMDGKRLKCEELIRDNGLDSGARGQAPWNGTCSTTTDCLDGMQRGQDQCVELIDPAGAPGAPTTQRQEDH